MDKHMEVMINRYGMVAAPAAPQMFGNAGREHMEKYGTCYMCVKWRNSLHELKYECYGCILDCVSQCFTMSILFKARNRNTLLKLPGKTTSIRPTTRKTLLVPL